MIVPSYWAEARRASRSGRRQLTIRRFGWSDESAAAAQAHAEQRVDEALAQALALRDRLGGGASGLPIT